jgi:hypothetical protein
MHKIGIFLICLMLIVPFTFGQQIIPESITKDLILKPIGKPYESNGFTLEKGVTLTILPGTEIKFDNKDGKKGYIEILGTLKIGNPAQSSAKPVVFNGNLGEIHFKDSTIAIGGWETEGPRIQFFGDNTGIIKNSKLKRKHSISYSLNITVPKKPKLEFIDCLIEDMDVEINTSDFPNDLGNLLISGCAFTYVFVPKDQRGYYYKPINLSTLVFAYGTKCDNYNAVEFKAFNWKLKSPLATEWYIARDDIKKSVGGSTKEVKGYALKLSTKKLTKFVQPPDPAEAPKKEK